MLAFGKRPVNYIRAIGNGAVRQVGRLEVKFVVGPGYAVGHAAGGVAGDEREVFIGFAEILLEITRRLWCLASAVGDGSLKPLQVHGVDGDSQQLQLLGGTEQIDAEPFGVAANHVLSCEGCQPLLGGLQSVGPVHSFARGGEASPLSLTWPYLPAALGGLADQPRFTIDLEMILRMRVVPVVGKQRCQFLHDGGLEL